MPALALYRETPSGRIVPPVTTAHVPPAEPKVRDAEAAAALEGLAGAPKKEEQKAAPEVPAQTTQASDAAEDLGWLLAGILALFVLFVSRPGVKSLERLARARAFGKRVGGRLGPRLARWLGGLWLVVLSCAGEALDFFATELLERTPDAKPKVEAPADGKPLGS